jgi:hypothetical protein
MADVFKNWPYEHTNWSTTRVTDPGGQVKQLRSDEGVGRATRYSLGDAQVVRKDEQYRALEVVEKFSSGQAVHVRSEEDVAFPVTYCPGRHATWWD